ncbi:unnamed protein product, partial [Amoebophrya sp. A25]
DPRGGTTSAGSSLRAALKAQGKDVEQKFGREETSGASTRRHHDQDSGSASSFLAGRKVLSSSELFEDVKSPNLQTSTSISTTAASTSSTAKTMKRTRD